MAPNTRASSRWATSRVLALPELWTLVAQHSGLVGAWRLTEVCRASREGARVWLRALPGFVTCGGLGRDHEYKSGVWRLDLGELRWEHIADLALPRAGPACCAVRGGIAVLGGAHTRYVPGENELEDCYTASVEFLEFGDSEIGEQIQSKTLPPLACGPRSHSAAVAIHESQSELNQILLIGGDDGRDITPEVHKVDLATGVCTPLPPLLSHRRHVCTAARLPDGHVVCVGKNLGDAVGITAEILEEVAPDQGSLPGEVTWRWRELPGMSVARHACGGCVLSDGRFAVFGGTIGFDASTRTTTCEVLILDDGAERWETLPPMHEARYGFAFAAVGGCFIVAGGNISGSVEVYEEALGRWRRLPCSLPDDSGRILMGSSPM